MKNWEAMQVTVVGQVAEIVKGGKNSGRSSGSSRGTKGSR
jgi:hypothetical protein